jgi:hypothetical protein
LNIHYKSHGSHSNSFRLVSFHTPPPLKSLIFKHKIQCIAESFGQNEAAEATFEATEAAFEAALDTRIL